MKNQDKLVSEMLNGFDTLEEFAAGLTLTPGQKFKLSLQKLVVTLYRFFVLPFRKKVIHQFEADLKKLEAIRIEVPDHGLTAGPDNHYLTGEEIREFEQTGILGPFQAVGREQAIGLKELSMEAHRTDFGGKVFIGQEAREALKRHGDWSINKSGLFQALTVPELRELLREPAVAHRLASILGPDVICWRTQFIEKKPGDNGTFWHQNSAFQESSKGRKLTPTEDTSIPTIQLTVWVALTDVTVPNGAMRMIPGSFQDGRLERFYEFAASHTFDFLALMDKSRLDLALKAANFAAYEFTKAQAVFMAAMDRFPGIFKGNKIHDLTMKAGEAVIFTSLNMHASYSNTTEDDTRLAFIGRITSNSVKVYEGMEEDKYPTPEGYKNFSTAPISSIQLHGKDRFGHNRILEEPASPSSQPAPPETVTA